MLSSGWVRLGALFLAAATPFFAVFFVGVGLAVLFAGFPAFLPTDFLALTFFNGELLFEAAFGDAGAPFAVSLPSMRNLVRSRAPAIQPGARPKPDQVRPDLGSLNFGAPAPSRTSCQRLSWPLSW